MNKIKILALFGKSGSGKDTIQKWITSTFANTKGIVSCTTRPKRDNETDGVDYHFLSNEEFAQKVLSLDMLEASEFREWFYGTSLSELDPDKVNIGVFNLTGIDTIINDNRLSVIPVLVWARDKTRLLRALNREKNPDCAEICRRYAADEKDFNENYDFDYKIIINDENQIDEDKLMHAVLSIFDYFD